MDMIPIRRALLSVSDKTGLLDLARALAGHGVELVSTGGTAAALRGGGLAVREVAELTGAPEMLDGRVKTLHPAVHSGLLARRDVAAHMEAIGARGIGAIDLLVVNLYPFAATLAAGAGRDELIEQIDIGGPAMMRSAAKNHDARGGGDGSQQIMGRCWTEMAAHGGATTRGLRRRLAARAFAATAAYDAQIAAWFAGGSGGSTA